ASGAIGIGLPIVGLLGGSGGVAGSAIPSILREDHCGVVNHRAAVEDLIWLAGLHGGKTGTHVELMYKDRHVDGVGGIRIRALRCVAEYAIGHRFTTAAMGADRIVAGVAALLADDVASVGDWGAIRNPGEDAIGRGYGSDAELGEIALRLHTDA